MFNIPRRAVSRLKRSIIRGVHEARWFGAKRIDDPESARRVLDTDPGWAAPLTLRVTDVNTLRALTLPQRTDLHTRRLRLLVDFWEPPIDRWRGRALPIRHLTELRMRCEPRVQRAEVLVRLNEPVPLADIARSILPALAPGSGMHGAGFPSLAVDASVDGGVLAVLPTRAAERITPFPKTLSGVGLQNADVLIVGREGAPIDPPATWLLSFDPDHRFETTPRIRRPVIDLHLHNPIGRFQSFEPSPLPHDLVQTADDQLAVRTHEKTGEVVERLRFPLNAPVSHEIVRGLRGVEAVSLAALHLGEDARIAARIVELAATGVILHSLPEAVVLAGVDASLDARVRQPYRESTGLAREKRSVALRRDAMHNHGGFFELASAVQSMTGHRLLPRVSVIMSSMRADRIPNVLRMMAKQTYPHFEVIVVMHGVEAPDLAALSDEINGLDYRVVQQSADMLFGAALAAGVRHSDGDLITKLDDDDWYSEHHVWDLVLAYLYSGADLVGKTTEYLYFDGIDHTVHRKFSVERYHEQAAGGAMMLARSTFDGLGGWRPTPNSTDRSVLIALADAGGIAYRTHGLGYMYFRHTDSHTWVRTESQLLSGSVEQWRGMRLPETHDLGTRATLALTRGIDSAVDAR